MSNLGIYQYVIEAKFGTDYEYSHGEMLYHCPFCQELGKNIYDRKLYVNSYKGVYNCFRCGTTGKLFLDSDTKILSNKLYEVSDFIDLLKPKVTKSLDKVYIKLPPYEVYKYPNTLAYQYLESRGITPEMMRYYSIRAFGDDKFTKNRVVLPNLIIGKDWTDFYTSRSLVNSVTPRYYNSNVVPKSEVVFNLHRISDNTNIIINEGIINSIIAGKNSVAILGKVCSKSQFNQILSKSPKSVTISLDTDAEDMAQQLASRFSKAGVHSVRIMHLPDNKDASDLGYTEYMRYYESAEEYSRLNNLITLISEF